MKCTIKIFAVLALLPCALHAQSPGSFSTISATTSLSVGSSSFSGLRSIAVGAGAAADGDDSVAIGQISWVTGDSSFAAVDMAYAAGYASAALNYGNATAEAATSLNESHAWGSRSTAINYGLATGGGSFSQGGSSVSATFAAGFGQTTVPSYYSFAVGRFNDVNNAFGSLVSGTTWVDADPVLSVGIGANASSRKDAFTIYKDGKIRMTKRQGDIPMRQFGNGGGD